jgi:hypothetical protein
MSDAAPVIPVGSEARCNRLVANWTDGDLHAEFVPAQSTGHERIIPRRCDCDRDGEEGQRHQRGCPIFEATDEEAERVIPATDLRAWIAARYPKVGPLASGAVALTKAALLDDLSEWLDEHTAKAPTEPTHTRLELADLTAGMEIEVYLIASNDGWEWCPATVVEADEDGVRLRWPESGEQEFPVARKLPRMRAETPSGGER